MDYKIAQYSVMADQSQKKIKFFQDKQTRTLRELEQITTLQEKEQRRLSGELDLARKELDKMKREAMLKMEELRRMESGNQKI